MSHEFYPSFCLKETQFLAAQKNHLESTLNQITFNNKKEIADTEQDCLNKKQQLIRGWGFLWRA